VNCASFRSLTHWDPSRKCSRRTRRLPVSNKDPPRRQGRHPPQPRPPLRAGRESLTDRATQSHECRASDCLIVHARSMTAARPAVSGEYRVRSARNCFGNFPAGGSYGAADGFCLHRLLIAAFSSDVFPAGKRLTQAVYCAYQL
jgi:hypothetical protein